MSTNSLVAFGHEDGTVTSSYVHYDGYATGVGEVLLENYNSKELARELATTLGYASSLNKTVTLSRKGRENSAEPEVYIDFLDFEEYIRENSHLEYVYIWDNSPLTNKWMVASWSSTKRKINNGVCNDYEFESHWNGFEDLVTVFCREGYETVERFRGMVEEGEVGEDYREYASELSTLVEKWKCVKALALTPTS